MRNLVHKVSGKRAPTAESEEEELLEDDGELASGMTTPNSEGSVATGAGARRAAVGKAGGARRKAVRRR